MYAGSCTISFCKIGGGFQKEYPDIKLVIDERIASEIQENSDRYDFLILRENMMEDQKKFRFSPLYDDKLCAVLYEKTSALWKRSTSTERIER